MNAAFQWDTTRPLIMGILNVTPDSFSDGGQFFDLSRAVEHAGAMRTAGADIIDIGGESTRPGAQPVSPAEEMQRVLPVIQRLREGETPAEPRNGMARQEPRPPVQISIDTTKAEVARQALAAGARIVNDISALRFDAGMADIVRESGAGLVLMHMQGTPQTMQQAPRYDDVVREVHGFLAERIAFAEKKGIAKSQIAVDPGIGFGKTVEQNLQLLARLAEFRDLGCPILVGASRKSFIGRLLGREAPERLPGSLAVAAWAVLHGAGILRVHDVAETVDVVRLMGAMQQAG